MISRNVKSAFKVEKLHSIPRIRNLATHGSHGKYKRKNNNLLPSGNRQFSDDDSFDLVLAFYSFLPVL